MSANGEDADLRAGHPPALRVGNMRVSRNRSQSGGSREDTEASDPAPIDQSTGAFVPPNPQRVLLATQSGQETLIKDNSHVAVESVKKFHEKPQPTREKPPNSVNVQKKMQIQQPK